MRRRIIAPLAIALAAAAVGCGDDAPPPAAPEVDEAEAVDEDAPRRAVLSFQTRLRAEGFTMGVSDPTSTQVGVVGECERFAEVLPGVPLPEEESSEKLFASRSDSTSQVFVDATVAVSGDVDAVEERFELFTDDQVEACLGPAIEARFAPEAGAGGAGLRDFRFRPPRRTRVGQQSVAMAMSGIIELGGNEAPFTTDIRFARVGGLVATLTVSSVGEEADLDLDGLLAVLVDPT